MKYAEIRPISLYMHNIDYIEFMNCLTATALITLKRAIYEKVHE